MNMFSRLLHSDPDTAGGGAAETTTESAPDMDSTIGALFDKIEAEGRLDAPDTPAVAADAATVTAEDPEAAQRAAPVRDASGKFAKAAAAEADQDAAAAAAAAAKPVVTEAPAAVETKFVEPPKSWRGEAKAEWAKVPEVLRAEIYKREEDNFRGLEQYKTRAQNFDALHAVIAPHAEIIKAAGQNALENIGGLLNLQQVLSTGDNNQKIGTLLQIAANVGIKTEELLAGLQNPPPPPALDPRYDTQARRLEELERRLAQVQVAPHEAEVARFFADAKNEFLSEPGVSDAMIALITSGVAKDVQEAYDKACRLSDSVQAKVSAKKAEVDRKAQAERDTAEAKRKADLAAVATRASSINVKPRGATAGPAAKGTMDETISSLYDRLHGSGN